TGPGGSDTSTKTDYVSVGELAPVADFSGTPTSGAAPLDVAFTDLSTGTVTGWSWDFGDGGSSSLQNPSHTYTSGGKFTVSLTASGPGGSDTATKVAYITVTSGAFVQYGTGSGGAAGVPVLSGDGDLTPGSGSGFTLTLSNAAFGKPVTLFIGLGSGS